MPDHLYPGFRSARVIQDGVSPAPLRRRIPLDLDIGVPRFNADGSFAGYIGSAIDFSAQRLAQETLDRLSGKLLEAQEKDAAASHASFTMTSAKGLRSLARIEHSPRNLDVTPAQSARLQEVSEHCSEITEMSRRSPMNSLSILDHLGMIAAVRTSAVNSRDSRA